MIAGGSFYTLWLSKAGDTCGLYNTPKSCGKDMTCRAWFNLYVGVIDSIDSACL